MTSKEWLAQARIGADEPSDVLRLARQDPHLPPIATLRDLQTYLASKSHGDSLTGHAPKAWSRCVEAHRKRPGDIED